MLNSFEFGPPFHWEIAKLMVRTGVYRWRQHLYKYFRVCLGQNAMTSKSKTTITHNKIVNITPQTIEMLLYITDHLTNNSFAGLEAYICFQLQPEFL